MKAIFLFILSIAIGITASAQRGIRHRSPAYTPGTAYKNSGWFIGPGITYMLPEQRTQSLTMYTTDEAGTDTLYDGDFQRRGKIGAYLEAGRHHFIADRALLHHLDYGVDAKLLRGREQFEGTSGNSPAIIQSNSKYSDLFVGAFGNASHIITLADRHYLMNGLGINADFRVLGRRVEGAAYGASYQFPGIFTAQLHYKLSYIWRPESGIYVIPSIETPILTAYPWDGPKATLNYFTDRSRPFIICLRIQWLSKQDNRECEGQPGKGPSLDQGGKHDKNDLFGDQAKSMKKSKKKVNKRLQKGEKKGLRKKKKSSKKED